MIHFPPIIFNDINLFFLDGSNLSQTHISDDDDSELITPAPFMGVSEEATTPNNALQLFRTTVPVPSMGVSEEETTPSTALQLFRTSMLDQDAQYQRISVCRMDGILGLRRDILNVYKNPKNNLKVCPRVKFEDEQGVGSGPVREYFEEAIKVIDEGLPYSKDQLFLEGEEDHRIPTNDRELRITGAYRAMGKIIGHAALHSNSCLHGISPVFKKLLSSSGIDTTE